MSDHYVSDNKNQNDHGVTHITVQKLHQQDSNI